MADWGAFPQLVTTVQLPAVLDPTGSARSRLNAAHDKAVRRALERTLIKHQVTRIKQKFEPGSHERYNYKERREVTHRIKRQRGRPDVSLRKTGRTLQRFTRRRPHAIRIRGKASNGRVDATMVLKFPFPIRRQPTGGVEISDMATEVASADRADAKGIADDFAKFYQEELLLVLKPRQRKRLGL